MDMAVQLLEISETTILQAVEAELEEGTDRRPDRRQGNRLPIRTAPLGNRLRQSLAATA